MHICSFPSFLGTGMMLATHSGYRDTAKKPSSNCFFTSSFIFRDILGFIFLSFCFTGEHLGFRGNCIIQCRNLNQTYLGRTKQICLGSLTTELLIHLGRLRTYQCQPCLPSFLRQHLPWSSLPHWDSHVNFPFILHHTVHMVIWCLTPNTPICLSHTNVAIHLQPFRELSIVFHKISIN